MLIGFKGATLALPHASSTVLRLQRKIGMRGWRGLRRSKLLAEEDLRQGLGKMEVMKPQVQEANMAL